jgi:hypothetical protein|tara:strand:+ start:43 stop:156 length:114 start_codon:yes stop_codon:yes gene_type:complete
MRDLTELEDRLLETATLAEIVEKVNAIIDLILPEQVE